MLCFKVIFSAHFTLQSHLIVLGVPGICVQSHLNVFPVSAGPSAPVQDHSIQWLDSSCPPLSLSRAICNILIIMRDAPEWAPTGQDTWANLHNDSIWEALAFFTDGQINLS